MRSLLIVFTLCLVSFNSWSKDTVLKAVPEAVKARPRIMGESLPFLQVQDAVGKNVVLHNYTSGQFTVLVFAGTSVAHDENQERYFKSLMPFFKKIGYKLIIVFPTEAADPRVKSLKIPDNLEAFFDPDKEAFTAMGLADKKSKDSATINGVFIVGPDEVIRFQNATISNSTPLSGEILVFAAKQYKDLYQKAEGADRE